MSEYNESEGEANESRQGERQQSRNVMYNCVQIFKHVGKEAETAMSKYPKADHSQKVSPKSKRK